MKIKVMLTLLILIVVQSNTYAFDLPDSTKNSCDCTNWFPVFEAEEAAKRENTSNKELDKEGSKKPSANPKQQLLGEDLESPAFTAAGDATPTIYILELLTEPFGPLRPVAVDFRIIIRYEGGGRALNFNTGSNIDFTMLGDDIEGSWEPPSSKKPTKEKGDKKLKDQEEDKKAPKQQVNKPDCEQVCRQLYELISPNSSGYQK